MAKINLQYVKSYINRHGKVDTYFRRRGQPLVRLPGLPGSPEFMAAYNEVLGSPVAQAKIEPGATRTKPGTVAALITRHIASGAFQIARGSCASSTCCVPGSATSTSPSSNASMSS